MLELINKFRFGELEEVLEILKELNFELLEELNGYKTYRATDKMGEYEIFIIPQGLASIGLNGTYYRDITDIVNKIIK